MSNKEMVLEAISQLPDDVPMEEIARQIEFLQGLEEAQAQARRGEGTPIEEVGEMIKKWARR